MSLDECLVFTFFVYRSCLNSSCLDYSLILSFVLLNKGELLKEASCVYLSSLDTRSVRYLAPFLSMYCEIAFNNDLFGENATRAFLQGVANNSISCCDNQFSTTVCGREGQLAWTGKWKGEELMKCLWKCFQFCTNMYVEMRSSCKTRNQETAFLFPSFFPWILANISVAFLCSEVGCLFPVLSAGAKR